MEFENLPYFMAHPGIYNTAGGNRYSSYLTLPAENTLMQDMEYFGQMYPAKVKKYQTRIKEVMNKLDYEGSVIYDEFPDRFSLERMVDSITDIIIREERTNGEKDVTKESEKPLVFVLMCVEVYKRRCAGKNKYII